MALPKTDAFTAADGTALSTYDATWKYNTGVYAINTNAAYSNSAGIETGCFYDDAAFTANQYSQIELVARAAGFYIGPSVRNGAAGVASYYGMYGDSVNLYFFKIVTGTYTDLQSSIAPSNAIGSIFYIEANGTTITAKKNGTNAFTPTTDSALSSGKAGMCGYDGSSTTRADNLDVGNLGGAASTPRLLMLGVG